MQLVVIKFVEVFTRGVLVVGVTYSLDIRDAGRFSIAVTLIGLFAFAFNWERHLDIQRRTAGASAAALDRAINDAIPFWAFNQAILLPVFLVIVAVMAKLTPLELFLSVLIVSGEHVANQTYQIAIVARRYWVFQIIVAIKNAMVLVIVLPYIIFAPSQLSLTFVLATWAVGQTACGIAVTWIWRGRSRPGPPLRKGIDERIFAQHRASLSHFQLGVVAILSLQLDRLAVSILVPLAEAGMFFRHVLVVSFVYQFFNVASFNRILPAVFAAAKHQPIQSLWKPIRRELAMVIGVVIIGFGVALGIDAGSGWKISAKYQLSFPLASILLLGALFRITADFTGLICNARHHEKKVLHNQLLTFAIGAPLLITLTIAFALIGTAVAGAVSSALYLYLNFRTVRFLPQWPPPQASNFHDGTIQ